MTGTGTGPGTGTGGKYVTRRPGPREPKKAIGRELRAGYAASPTDTHRRLTLHTVSLVGPARLFVSLCEPRVTQPRAH